MQMLDGLLRQVLCAFRPHHAATFGVARRFPHGTGGSPEIGWLGQTSSSWRSCAAFGVDPRDAMIKLTHALIGFVALLCLMGVPTVRAAEPAQSPQSEAAGSKPNIVVIFGDDIG
ncbi:MAG: hypothetical protein WBE89_17590, partial [Methyloceanibacter sp.]